MSSPGKALPWNGPRPGQRTATTGLGPQTNGEGSVLEEEKTILRVLGGRRKWDPGKKGAGFFRNSQQGGISSHKLSPFFETARIPKLNRGNKELSQS